MNRWMISLRTVLRKLGITPILASVMNRLGLFGGGEGYEERFSQEMLDDLRRVVAYFESQPGHQKKGEGSHFRH